MTVKAGVIGIGSALPEHIVTNKDFEAYLDTTDAWIRRRTGIRERRHLNGSVTLTDLALQACRDALQDAGVDAAGVDHVIVATFTPDRLMPGLAPKLAKLLGTRGAGAIDVNAACAGFLYGLDQSAALIESGRVERALVVGAEALSRVTDPHDRGTAILFADGAAAVVVEAAEIEHGCSPFVLASDGEHGDLLYADREERLLRMEGQEVYRHAVERMVEATAEALRRADLTVDDIDVLIVHQANQRIIDAAARRLKVPEEKVFANVDTIANTSSASIPLALHHAEQRGRLKPGDTVALAAFGGGFVWGAGIVCWKERVHARA
ncbi:MAG TPA: beta-ketoacyl-ACP synthase III [Solirubrobacteraceae bacterium]|nr:beta-ketoacyl-ACP synthase III [Solirubrobacteraceae bacterium]